MVLKRKLPSQSGAGADLGEVNPQSGTDFSEPLPSQKPKKAPDPFAIDEDPQLSSGGFEGPVMDAPVGRPKFNLPGDEAPFEERRPTPRPGSTNPADALAASLPAKPKAYSAPPSFGGDDAPTRPAPNPPRPAMAPPPAASKPAADDGGWDLEDLVDLPTPAAAPIPTAERPSPFGEPKRGAEMESPKAPPWKASAGGKKEAPIIPGMNKGGALNAARGGGLSGAVVSVVVLAVLGGGLYMFVQKRDKAIEMVGRWTGAYTQVSQELPAETDTPAASSTTGVKSADGSKVSIPTEDMVTPDEMAAAAETSPSEAAADTTAKVDFVDEDPRTATDKIVADKNTDMPEDVSIVAAFQNALDKQRQARDASGGTPAPAPTAEEKPSTSPGDLPTPEARLDASNKLIEENKRELDAYLKALTETENPALKPKPSEFFNAPGGKGGTLTPPPQTPVAATAASVPAAGMAGNVMAEPGPQPDVPQIRSLGDFDVSMFTPQEERIRIPKGVRPRIAAAEFPPLEVLSFVPNYGVIAARQGREGVLLIGERLEGWELISVSDAYAEFRLGERKHTVTLDNANRQP